MAVPAISFAAPQGVAVNLCEMTADPSHVVFEKRNLAGPSHLAAVFLVPLRAAESEASQLALGRPYPNVENGYLAQKDTARGKVQTGRREMIPRSEPPFLVARGQCTVAAKANTQSILESRTRDKSRCLCGCGPRALVDQQDRRFGLDLDDAPLRPIGAQTAQLETVLYR